jgi:hypothetical protein
MTGIRFSRTGKPTYVGRRGRGEPAGAVCASEHASQNLKIE